MDKEKLIDMFLNFLFQGLEDEGLPYNMPHFHVHETGKHFCEFKSKYSLSTKDVHSIVNTCITRNYIKYSELGSDGLKAITPEGYERIQNSQKHNEVSMGVTVHGNTNSTIIVGNNNTTISLQDVLAAIDSSSASAEEKEEAKSLITKLMVHPLFTASASQLVPLFAKILGLP